MILESKVKVVYMLPNPLTGVPKVFTVQQKYKCGFIILKHKFKKESLHYA